MESQKQGTVGTLGLDHAQGVCVSLRAEVITKVLGEHLGQEGTCAQQGYLEHSHWWPRGVGNPGEWDHEGQRAWEYPGTKTRVTKDLRVLWGGSL